MNVKALKKIRLSLVPILFASHTGAFASGTVWSGSPLGKCYSSVSEYMSQTFGESYKEDENLKITNATKKGDYKWVFDATPETNITRVLFEIKNKSACAILYAPLSSTVTTDKGTYLFVNKPQFFVSTDTAASGFPTTKIVYMRNKKGLFEPTSCFHIIDKLEKKINCNNVFDN